MRDRTRPGLDLFPEAEPGRVGVQQGAAVAVLEPVRRNRRRDRAVALGVAGVELTRVGVVPAGQHVHPAGDRIGPLRLVPLYLNPARTTRIIGVDAGPTGSILLINPYPPLGRLSG